MIKTTKKLLLIDGNAIIHRSFHALPPLTTKKGEMVNAVYGFASTLLSVMEKFQPDYIVASFDLAGPTFRHKEYADYKATRVKAPDELYAQIDRVKEVVKAFNIPIYEQQGFEADDVIGTIVRQAENLKVDFDLENIIVTGDLDALQLITPKTKVFTLKRGINDTVLYDEEKVWERYGIKPEQLRDFKGLRGDASDNIPGVKGIGEKTATELLKKFGSLENVYANLAELKGAVKDKLERDRVNAKLSKELGTIKTNVSLEFDLEKAQTHDFDRQKVVALFQELNFFSLIKRLSKNFETVSLDQESSEVRDFKYIVVEENNFSEFISEINQQEIVALSVLGESGVSGIGFSWKSGRAWFVKKEFGFSKEVKNILESAEIKKIGHNLKNIYRQLKAENIQFRGIYFDVMVAQYVIDPGGKNDLETLVLSEIGEELKNEKKNQSQLTLGIVAEEVSQEKIQRTCQIADYVWKLKKNLERKMEEIETEQKSERKTEKTIRELFFDMEIPLIEVLAEMENAGVKINKLVLAGISETIENKLKTLEKSIYKISGVEFNINSPKQLQNVLFEKMQLSTTDIKKTKTGISTASSELQKMREQSPIIEKIEEYRELFKLKTTYLDVFPTLTDRNSRIHTTFNQTVTATGRLSSTEPNLQNIPIKTDLGKMIRTAFVAEDGFCLVSADYSQIDLRAVAHVSGDKKMIEAFHRGDDIHRLTASEINKVSASQVTEKMRRAAKALNFGIIYGMGSFGFSQAAGVERVEAQKFIREYLEKFSGVAEYIKNTKESAKKNHYVETLLGRRRNIPEINSPNFQVANAAERMAINMPIQGLAADIVKLAMIKVYDEYKNNPNVRMILQVHDEIILETKEEISEAVGKRVKEIMESVYQLRVPLVVDVKTGDSWGEV